MADDERINVPLTDGDASPTDEISLEATDEIQLIPPEPPRNYKEFRLNVDAQRQVFDLPFLADMVFVLNNSDAWLYLGQGGTSVPSIDFHDLAFPPKSYTILEPHSGWQWGAFLDSPTAKDCWVIFAFGYADEYAALQSINAIPSPTFFFDWSLAIPLCRLSDFLLSDDGWTAFASCTYTLGVGFVGNNPGSPQIDLLTVFIEQLNAITVDYDVVGAGTVAYEIRILVYSGGVLQNPPTGSLIGIVDGADPAGSYTQSLDLSALSPSIRTGDEFNLWFIASGGVNHSINITGLQIDYAGTSYAVDNCP